MVIRIFLCSVFLFFSCHPSGNSPVKQPVKDTVIKVYAPSSEEKGKSLFQLNCIACHRKVYELEKVIRTSNLEQLKELLNSSRHPTKFPTLDTSDISSIKAFILEDGQI